MLRTVAFALAVLMLPAAFAAAAEGDGITIEQLPPVVVKAVPESGSTEVDPATTEIKVTFSKEMIDGNWSWVTLSEATYPKTTGKPKYLEDNKTCVLPVKLEAGKTYAILINSEKFTNFKDMGGTSALPYLLIFKTKK